MTANRVNKKKAMKLKIGDRLSRRHHGFCDWSQGHD